MRKLTVGSCFSGIGGLELGLEWTGGFETKWQIENDEYATRVLTKHWPDVQRYTDIRDVVQPPAVDVICGGFPCQDVSFAGKRAGLEGKRSTLWSELFRLVCEVRPKWLLAENVPGLLSSDDGRFFGNILRDLASIGFDAEWGMLSAAGVGAPHLRRRVFILAHSMRSGGSSQLGIEQGEWTEISNSSCSGDVANACCQRRQQIPRSTHGDETENEGRPPEKGNQSSGDGKGRGAWVMANAGSSGCQRRRERSEEETRIGTHGEPSGCCWWRSEPNVGRVAHGFSFRVDRLRCLGNAVVPQVAQKVGEMILKYEAQK